MTSCRIMIAAFALAICVGQAAAESTSNGTVKAMNEKTAIEATLKQYEAALNASDVAGVLALYVEDGVFMPSEAPTAVGHDQVRAAYEHVFGMIQLKIAFSIDEVAPDGDFAFARTISRGEVTILSAGVTVPEENRELFILKKVGDDWKIARYMFNKMAPQAGK